MWLVPYPNLNKRLNNEFKQGHRLEAATLLTIPNNRMLRELLNSLLDLLMSQWSRKADNSVLDTCMVWFSFLLILVTICSLPTAFQIIPASNCRTPAPFIWACAIIPTASYKINHLGGLFAWYSLINKASLKDAILTNAVLDEIFPWCTEVFRITVETSQF